MKKIYNDDTLLKRIKKQIRIWEAYYNETGHYREETIFLDTGDTAVYDPYVSECMRFKVDPKAYYGEEAYQAWPVIIGRKRSFWITEKKHTKHGWRT